MSIPARLARCGVPLLALTLAGCASLPADWGRAGTTAAAAERGLSWPADSPAALRARLLATPLDSEGAIQLALLHNPELHAATTRLGYVAAEVYEAARLANPVLSLARLSTDDPEALRAQLNLGVAVNFTELLFLPARRRLARAEFETTQLQLAGEVLALAAAVEADWYRLAGARQQAAMRAAIARAARASAELAQRHFDAGTLNRKALALEQAAATEAGLAADTAALAEADAQAALARRMGLAATDRWQIAGGLPALPADDPDAAQLRPLAEAGRLDLVLARREAEAAARAAGVERWQGRLGELELGYAWERETDGSRRRGPELAWAPPLFDGGRGAEARAQARLAAAQAGLRARELDLATDLDQAERTLRYARRRAEQLRDALIPQRQQVGEELRRELNYMLVGPFEALLARQQEWAAQADYLDAVRDYWIARSALAQAVGRRLPVPQSGDGAQRLDAETLLATPVEAEEPHAHHHGPQGNPPEATDAPKAEPPEPHEHHQNHQNHQHHQNHGGHEP